MPAEVGQYTINLAWNDVEVDGMSSSDHLHLTQELMHCIA